MKCLFTYIKDTEEIRVQAEFLLYHFFQLFTVPVQYSATILTAQCKKWLVIFSFPARMSLTKLSLAGKWFNHSKPGRVWLVKSHLGTGKSLTFFYSAWWFGPETECIHYTVVYFDLYLYLKNTFSYAFGFKVWKQCYQKLLNFAANSESIKKYSKNLLQKSYYSLKVGFFIFNV
jgi:hypothetical protein